MKKQTTILFLVLSIALAGICAVATSVLSVNADDCTNCGLCIEVCPTEAISTHEVDGKTVAVIDPDECTRCGLCIETCPTEAITESPVKLPVEKAEEVQE